MGVATVGSKLGLNVSVIVPQTTKELVIDKLRSLGAKVTVHGKNWNEADTLARKTVDENPEKLKYVSPYDNPLLWTGHSTVVDEICDQLLNEGNDNNNNNSNNNPTIGAIVVSGWWWIDLWCIGGMFPPE